MLFHKKVGYLHFIKNFNYIFKITYNDRTDFTRSGRAVGG